MSLLRIKNTFPVGNHSYCCNYVIIIYIFSLLQDHQDTARLLAFENVNQEALANYACEAADFCTKHKMPHMDFAVNHYGRPDLAMFDFTSLFQAENSCRVLERQGKKLLTMLVGDSLLEVRSDVNCRGVTNKQQYSLLSLLVKLKRNSQTLPIIYGIASIVI